MVEPNKGLLRVYMQIRWCFPIEILGHCNLVARKQSLLTDGSWSMAGPHFG